MQISEAESAVMEVLWRRRSAYADDVVAALSQTRDWQEATIKTLLNRLLKKGAVAAEKDGRRYRYSAVLQRDDWQQREADSLVDRLFGGRIAPLVAQFSERNRLSRRDIAELKRLIEELDNGR
ncbi:BlaI/MecI/CopY family transcriptional regulator [Chiayiivirga flava]|uniref:Putative transcriptional regulator n=1 Tax=Chiayiivirga flava TaxID=659595 RepID=A0A7W8D7F4_9GAMM|nr:putative transcriptional regulator [Chiayiivirga flava]